MATESLTPDDLSILQNVPRDHGPTTLDARIAEHLTNTLETLAALRLMCESQPDALHTDASGDVVVAIEALKRARAKVLASE